MNASVTVRTAQLPDLSVLVRFNQAMALETEGKQLDIEPLTEGVRRVLQKQATAFYFLAESNQQVVASLMVTEEWSDWRAQRFWWLQSVFVEPTYRRQGIFSALFNAVQTRAEQQGDVCGVRLYVEKNNRTAQRTYQTLGFSESPYFMYETSSVNTAPAED